MSRGHTPSLILMKATYPIIYEDILFLICSDKIYALKSSRNLAGVFLGLDFLTWAIIITVLAATIGIVLILYRKKRRERIHSSNLVSALQPSINFTVSVKCKPLSKAKLKDTLCLSKSIFSTIQRTHNLISAWNLQATTFKLGERVFPFLFHPRLF
jgi:hypothetical protein